VLARKLTTAAVIVGVGVLLALAITLADDAGGQAAGTDVLLAAGDIAPDTSATTANDYATSELVLRELAGSPRALVAGLGDLQYEVAAGVAFRSQLGYAGSWGRFADRTCPAAGNHEYMTPGAAGFFDYFGERLAACATSGRPDLGWYAFDLPASGWRWYVLSSDCGRTGGSPGCGAGSAQDAWLAGDLAANAGRRCIGASWHHERWGSRAPFGDDAALAGFWSRLNHVHADLVLVGHSHAYARLGPMTPQGHLSALGAGIRQITAGTGGRSLIAFSTTPREGTRYRDAAHYGVLRLQLTATTWASSFVRTDGVVADQVSAGCWP
jgi:hypothetical protein